MARRDSDYSCVRRIADRGNGKDGPDSRARGEDRYLTRRIADRGSGRVGVDPWDFEIRRLRRRVRDLELQHEIMRLKKRIWDLEASPVWEETEPEELVGDELTGDEEHPTHHGFIYHSPPCFDKYEDEEVSQEDYLWVTQALNGKNNEGDDEHDGEEDFPVVIFDDFIKEEYTVARGDEVSYGGDTVVHGGSVTPIALDGIATIKETSEDLVEIPSQLPKDVFGLNITPIITGYGVGKIIQIVHNIVVSIIDKGERMPPFHVDTTRGIPKTNKAIQLDVVENVEARPMHEDSLQKSTHAATICCRPPILASAACGLHLKPSVGKFSNLNEMLAKSLVGLQNCDGPTLELNSPSKLNGSPIGGDPKDERNGRYMQQLGEMTLTVELFTRVFFDVPYDPGGTVSELGEKADDVKQFRRVVMIILSGCRVDVPYDPGGFGPKAKLEDEFFLKTGSMMQGHIIISYIFI
ncbi:hypothetical protein Hanom_Chr00s176842g01830811 [Helianthus anomalus]